MFKYHQYRFYHVCSDEYILFAGGTTHSVAPVGRLRYGWLGDEATSRGPRPAARLPAEVNGYCRNGAPEINTNVPRTRESGSGSLDVYSNLSNGTWFRSYTNT